MQHEICTFNILDVILYGKQKKILLYFFTGLFLLFIKKQNIVISFLDTFLPHN